METKLFSETFDDAFEQGVRNYKNDEVFHVIEVEVTGSMYDKLLKSNTIDEHITKGRNTIALDPSQVKEFKDNVISVKATEELKGEK